MSENVGKKLYRIYVPMARRDEEERPELLTEVIKAEGPKTYELEPRTDGGFTSGVRRRVDKGGMNYNGRLFFSAAEAWDDFQKRMVNTIEQAGREIARAQKMLELSRVARREDSIGPEGRMTTIIPQREGVTAIPGGTITVTEAPATTLSGGEPEE